MTPGPAAANGRPPPAHPPKEEGAPRPPGPLDELTPERFAEEITKDAAQPFPWRTVVKRSVVLLLAGVSIYLVLPTLTEVFGSWPRLATLDPWWFAVALVAQTLHFVCSGWLQRIALRTKAWYAVETAQLSGNAISLVLPGGAAAGAALQFRMLGTAGMDTSTSVGGLTAFSLLGIGGLLALPLFALPAVLLGVPVNSGLLRAALIGLAGFVLFAAFGAVVLSIDRPLLWCGRAVESVRNRMLRRREPLRGVGPHLVEERNRIRAVLGAQWRAALLLSAGRLGFDYCTLLAALRATGSRPHASLVLLAYALAGLIGLIPVTPGGLGLVEAGLTGLLVLAGVDSGRAVLAVLTYRLASYWLPMLAGPFAYVLFRIRYGPPTGHAVPDSG